jgi:fused signal recognition particle receptor
MGSEYPDDCRKIMSATQKTGWLSRLRAGLARTRDQITSAFTGAAIDDALYDELESALIMADVGMPATTHLLTQLRQRVRRDALRDAAQVRLALQDELTLLLKPVERVWTVDTARPYVVMVAGVNGSGKTTSIGKLTHWLHDQGHSVLLAAGDTFRAAAREQLAVWGERNGVEVIAQSGNDPAAVVFDAVSAARARGRHVLVADTAGRLPTQTHLMEELKRIKRAVGKSMDGAPHDVILVLDGTNGQNALNQLRAFDDAVGVTGLVVTKLDGTAKGGIIAALAHQRADNPVPILFIGVGESLQDLQPFVAADFARALIAADETDSGS